MSQILTKKSYTCIFQNAMKKIKQLINCNFRIRVLKYVLKYYNKITVLIGSFNQYEKVDNIIVKH